MDGEAPKWKLVVEGGLGAEKIVRQWLVVEDVRKEGTEKHRLCQCPCWKEVRSLIPETLGKGP